MVFEDKKFFLKREYIVIDEYGEKKRKAEFEMTRKYRAWLREKARAEREQAYRVQLAKCKALFAKEGAVDDVEFGYLELLRSQL